MLIFEYNVKAKIACEHDDADGNRCTNEIERCSSQNWSSEVCKALVLQEMRNKGWKTEGRILCDEHNKFVFANNPGVTLSNGLCVVNFSSPHEFRFTDGSVLPAVNAELSILLSLEAVEVNQKRSTHLDVRLEFLMTKAVSERLTELCNVQEVDIVLVPLPVMEAIKEKRRELSYDLTTDSDVRLWQSKCRVVRMADRIRKIIHHDKFCI